MVNEGAGEVRAQERSQAGHPFPDAHFEVDGVHAELLGMEVAQLGEGTSDVIDVVGSIYQRSCHLLAMRLDLSGAR